VTTDSAATLTKQGITAQQAGDTTAALRLLVRAVQADPAYEMAWLWLASCLSTPGEKRYCLDQALIANPQSAPARTGLAQLGDVRSVMPTALGTVPAPSELVGGAKPAKKRLSPLAFAGIVIGVIVLSCVFLSVTGLGLKLLQSAPGPRIEGWEGHIVPTGNDTLAARDMPTFDQLSKVSPADLGKLIDGGQAFLVPAGTRVLVLDVQVPRTHVRFLDGEHTGDDGWVLTTFVQQ
jgi:hypothetical protein